ncbi:DUF4112 domain-containing protein [Halobaculum sp. MBLA0147]|uniref:DUF4112 domain-containing protein n=1 Tax=Halobaculum sp. MBLA0147 TaxID=3079934 RepID=UPI0035241EC0
MTDPDTLGERFETLETDQLPESVDRAAVERLSTVAYLLDECIELPGGVSVGLDPLVSAVPGVGDALSTGLSLYVVAEAAYLGVSYGTVVRMLGNVAVDTVGGSVPVVGIAFDALWKTNRMNLELLVADLADDGAGADTPGETAVEGATGEDTATGDADDTDTTDGHGDPATTDHDDTATEVVEIAVTGPDE